MAPIALIYHATLDLPLCNPCGRAIEFDGVKRHARKNHNLSTKQAEDMDSLLRIEQKTSLADTRIDSTLRKKYIITASPSYRSGPSLPYLEGLHVTSCYKCPDCGYIAPVADSVRRNCTASIVCSGDVGRELVEVNAQTIFGGNKRKYYEILDAERPVSALSTAMKKLYGSQPAETSVVGADISEMNSLLSVFRFDNHLRRHDLSMAQAHDLRNFSDADTRKFVRKLISTYHKRAFYITEKKVYIKTHTLMDSDLNLALNKKTVELYNNRVSHILAFVLNLVKQNSLLLSIVPRDVAAKLRALVGDLNASHQFLHKDLHSILYTLFFAETTDENESLLLFISCCSVVSSGNNESFRFANSSDLSPLLAALKHFARCIAVMDIYEYGAQNTSEAWERISNLTLGNVDNGIRYAQYCMKVCNRMRSGEAHAIRFVVCPTHPYCAIVDEVELSLPDLGSKMDWLQQQCWNLLSEKLLKGLKLTDAFWSSVENFEDNLTELTPAYWFGMHKANLHHMLHWSTSLLERHRSSILRSDDTLHEPQAKQFLQHCDELQEFIYTLLQTCSGGPARATEIGILRVCNNSIGPRNIFFHAGYLFTVITYHKCRKVEDGSGHPVARYPDRVTAGIILIYLLVVRPLEVAIVQLLHGEEKDTTGHLAIEEIKETDDPLLASRGATHRDHLFVSRGKPLSIERLRYAFEKSMKSAGIPIGTSQYRQYHGGVVKNFLGYTEEADPQGKIALHKQSGHSEKTAHQVYGVSTMDMRSLTATELERYRQASKSWHEAIGLLHGKPCSLQQARSESSGRSKTEIHSPGKPTSVAITDQIVRLEKKIDDNFQILYKAISNGTTNPEAIRPKRPLEEALPKHDRDPPTKKLRPSPSLRTHLQAFLENEDADFTSKEQEVSISHAVDSREDALVVLPTGAGKSLTFMLSAYIHKTKVVVVIVPLVALQLDLIKRCSNAGLQASRWNDRDVAGARIVIASVEHLASTAYKSYIREVHATKRLHAIFVDEAHLVLLWRGFRDILRHFHDFVRPDPVQAPVITLTATAPPSLQKEIASSCGMADFTVIRQETARGNIRYEVLDVTRETLYRKVDSMLFSFYADKVSSKAIVYVATRADCDSLCLTLNALSQNIPCFKYHAGMTEVDRTAMHKNWEDDSDRSHHVMVATAAFGCGIDVPNVRIVIHAGQPRTLTEFIQESGRAGRDGKPATSIVLNTITQHSLSDHPQDRIPCADVRNDSSPLPSSEWNINMFGPVDKIREDASECRRWILDSFNDGKRCVLTCQDRAMEPCDNCSNRKGILHNTSSQQSPPVELSQLDSHPSCEQEDDYRRGLPHNWFNESPNDSKPRVLARTRPNRIYAEGKSVPGSRPNKNMQVYRSGTSGSVPGSRPNKNMQVYRSGTSSDSTSATAGDIRLGFSARLTENFCPVCTVLQGCPVEHAQSNKESKWSCYRQRCLRCGLTDHGLKDCPMFKSTGKDGSCYSCKFRLFRGSQIHPSGSYGQSSCPIKKLMCLAFLTWEDVRRRRLMVDFFPAIASISTIQDFERWLRDENGTHAPGTPGLSFFAPWFFAQVLGTPV